MDTLEKVAAALGNDPTYFETIAAGLDSKASLSLVTSGLAGKADLTTTTNELATKATTSSVTDLTARIVNTERVVTVEPNVTFNYLETGADALVIRGPNEISANFLGPSSGVLEGRAVFYKDLLINKGDLLLSTGNILLGPLNNQLNVATELASKEPAFSVISPLSKGFSFTSNAFELKLDEALPLRASNFQTGKFRLSSPDDGSVRIQRFDDDGSTVTDAWQDVAMFRWDDSLGGSMLIDRISARTTANIVFEDAPIMNAGATVNGMLNASSSNLQNIRGVDAIFAKGSGGIGIHTADGTLALEIQDTTNITAYNNFDVRGNLSCSGTLPSPYWVAGVFDQQGNVSTQKGRFSFSAAVASGFTTTFDLTFPEHPEGANWTHSVNSTMYHTFIRNKTSTSVRVYMRTDGNGDGWQGDGFTSFMILI